MREGLIATSLLSSIHCISIVSVETFQIPVCNKQCDADYPMAAKKVLHIPHLAKIYYLKRAVKLTADR